MAKQKNYLAIFSLVFIIFLIAFVFPVLILSLDSPDTISLQQSEDETVTLTTGLDAVLDDVEDGGKDNITVTLINTNTGESITETSISEGDSVVTTLNGDSITISNLDKLSNKKALVSYEFPLFFGWPEGAKTIFENITNIVIILVILFVVSFIIVLIEVYSDGN